MNIVKARKCSFISANVSLNPKDTFVETGIDFFYCDLLPENQTINLEKYFR